jgi:type IV pilus assembly protein PilX
MSSPRPSLPRRPAARGRLKQRGVILVVVLLAMVVLLIGLAGLLRTVDTSGVIVGNLAFRRDLTNRAEQAIAAAKLTLQSTTVDFTADALSASHYSATKLANGNTGVPTMLDSNTYNSSIGSDTADGSVSGDTSISYRYVIDRQCNTGTTAFSTAACEYITTTNTLGCSAQNCAGDKRIASRTLPIYRISVRVQGPRNSVAYFQTTYVSS